MKIRWIIVAGLLLAACSAANNGMNRMNQGGDHSMGSGSGRSLGLFNESNGTKGEIAFTIYTGNDVFTDYGVAHERTMHVIVVRDDLRYFAHLHPAMDDKGAWRASFKPPAGGKYWVYADFVEGNGTEHVIRFDQSFPGMPGERGIVKQPKVREKTVDGYHVRFSADRNGGPFNFRFTVTDANGKPVPLEPYLGAMGHAVLINPDAGYIHLHPSGKELVFSYIGFLRSPFYRIFAEFKAGGTVHIVSFDWEP